jgi:hypothetical protein
MLLSERRGIDGRWVFAVFKIQYGTVPVDVQIYRITYTVL